MQVNSLPPEPPENQYVIYRHEHSILLAVSLPDLFLLDPPFILSHPQKHLKLQAALTLDEGEMAITNYVRYKFVLWVVSY